MFWQALKYPVIGLSPMDGVTDAAFRYVTDVIGKPDLLVTEFTAVEAIARGKTAVLDAFLAHPTTTPTTAQIFGTEVVSYYQSALTIAALGFDGIDINMGCPAKNVSQRGAGAGLIQTPKLAKEIVRTTKQAVVDWSNGITLEDGGVHPDVITWIKQQSPHRKKSFSQANSKRTLLPVSIKTRIGYDKPIAAEWISQLIETAPSAVALHGRTLKQMYTGHADWDQIGRAAEIAKLAKIPLLGNGDVLNRSQALQKVKDYGVSGVLIGRGSFGNPWAFKDQIPSVTQRLQAAKQHTRYFAESLGHTHFLSMRKHLAWYCKDFPNASEVRTLLMQVQSADDVDAVLNPFIQAQATVV